jgi:hypothetical protein
MTTSTTLLCAGGHAGYHQRVNKIYILSLQVCLYSTGLCLTLQVCNSTTLHICFSLKMLSLPDFGLAEGFIEVDDKIGEMVGDGDVGK